MNLRKIQDDLGRWQRKNFLDTGPEWLLLGAVEEMGELTHLVLKRRQGIREAKTKSKEELKLLVEDAVADIVIYLINFCNLEDIDFQGALQRTVEHILKRDWITDPENGG